MSQRQKVLLDPSVLAYLEKNTQADGAKLRAQFDNFIEKHPSGDINRKDFGDFVKECYPEKDYTKIEKKLFNMYDVDRSGTINFKEFMMALHIMSEGSPEQNLRQIFRVFDDSNDGKIEKNEMKKFIKDIEDLITDSDLKSSGLQRHDSKKKKTLAENAMAEMDIDGDGCITEDEFVKAILEHGKVSKILALKVIDLLLPSPPTTPTVTTTAP